MTYFAQVIAGGKIVIPAGLRRELNIEEGDSLVIERAADGGLLVETYPQVVAEGQRNFRSLVGPDYSVDQFLAERRADWREE